MRKNLFIAAGALALLCTPPAFGMGGGGGSPSGYGSVNSSSPSEYKTALKLIDQKKYAESIPPPGDRACQEAEGCRHPQLSWLHAAQ